MPGIYVNDGGGTASALGNALGGMAANFGPEAQAKALLLRMQTEEADRQNNRLEAIRQGALAMPQYLNAPGVSADPTANVGGGVAGTLAGAAVPPGPMQPFQRGETASFSPYSRIVAGSYYNDPSMANLQTGVNLGRSGTLGPGQDYSTQADIVRAQHAPQHVPVGETLVRDPTQGNAPGNVIYGGSPVEQEVQSQTAKDALGDQKAGAQASDAIAQLSALQALRRTVVQGHFTPGDVLFDEAAKKLDAYFGTGAFTRLNNRQDIMNAIRARMKAITAATRSAYAGDPALRGLSAQLDDSLPDPESDQFDNSVGALTKTLGATVDDANAANEFLKNPGSPRAADDYRSGKLSRHAAAAAAAAAALKTAGGGGGEGEGSAAAPAAKPQNVQLVPDIATGEKLPSGSFFRTPDGQLHKVQ